MAVSMNYIIFATPRTGSFLLCDALASTGLAGSPSEFFGPNQLASTLSRQGHHTYADCLAWIVQKYTTPNGVFGAKIIWPFFEYFIDDLREIPGYERLTVPELMSTTFPNLRVIWTTRRDKVRQAVSYLKAHQTRQWVDLGLRQSLPSSGVEPKFDLRTIDVILKGIIEDEAEIARFLADQNITPFTVVYEDFAANYEDTTREVLDFLKIPLPSDFTVAEPRMKRQANQQTQEWVQRYYELKGLAAPTIN